MIRGFIQIHWQQLLFPIHIGINTTYNYSTWQPWFSAMAFKRLGAESQILQIWMIWCQKLHFHFLGSYLDTLRGSEDFFIKIFVFWRWSGCKIPFFDSLFCLGNWLGNLGVKRLKNCLMAIIFNNLRPNLVGYLQIT